MVHSALGVRRARSGSAGRRSGVVAALLAALVLGGVGAATAANTGWRSISQQWNGNDKVSFDSGQKLWYSRSDNHGGFRIGGHVNDRSVNDRAVEFRLQIAAYSPWKFKGDQWLDTNVVRWDPDLLATHEFHHRVCELQYFGDDCSGWKYHYNPYY